MELRQLFGPIDYWLRRGAMEPVADDALFDKRRKEVHRYTIADVNGPLTLTVPIVKPHGLQNATWQDVRLSDHGQWWHVHRISLESAYGRTPFFEFYIDRFLPFLSREAVDRFPSIIAYDRAIDAEISRILFPKGLPAFSNESFERHESFETASNGRFCAPSDCEGKARAKEAVPYWQPRQERFGFIGGLSILDLIFCLGPEAALYLQRLSANQS
jgi:hypothetical protein